MCSAEVTVRVCDSVEASERTVRSSELNISVSVDF